MSNREGVPDLAKEAKKGCGNKKASFMRKYDAFQSLIKAEVQVAMLKEAYKVLGWAYEALDKSHKDYTNLVNEATIMAEGDHIEEFFKLYSEAQVTYS